MSSMNYDLERILRRTISEAGELERGGDEFENYLFKLNALDAANVIGAKYYNKPALNGITDVTRDTPVETAIAYIRYRNSGGKFAPVDFVINLMAKNAYKAFFVLDHVLELGDDYYADANPFCVINTTEENNLPEYLGSISVVHNGDLKPIPGRIDYAPEDVHPEDVEYICDYHGRLLGYWE